MENPYEQDRERIIEINISVEQCLKEFKVKLAEFYPDVDIDFIIQKPVINSNPIISYGIIEFVRKADKIYYHVFRKRNTVEYDTIIRGFASKYQLFDMLCLLSQDERDRILKCDFDTLWDDYWVDHDGRGYLKLYKKSKEIFRETKELLKIINKYIPCKITVRPLIFPKGRKNGDENPLQAALREAQEETKVSFISNKYESLIQEEKEIYFNDPIVRHYIGSDDKKYTDYYYVWRRNDLYRSPVQKLSISIGYGKPKQRLRTETIGHELESDIWIEIPIFPSKNSQWEWENSIDSYNSYGIFHRHFRILLEIHSRLTE